MELTIVFWDDDVFGKYILTIASNAGHLAAKFVLFSRSGFADFVHEVLVKFNDLDAGAVE